ncbi:MAG: type II and III secretion system protein family protein [Ancalomicrobiaceae bacterium]|nr:type II and III secretion system protein family protein [Ancalomicrobiaceae bacterium]
MFARLVSRTILFAALIAATVPALAGDQPQDPQVNQSFKPTVTTAASTRRINLPMSKSTIIDFDSDIRDILVANPAIADAVVRTNRRLYIIGNKYGVTNIYVYGANNHQIANIELQIQPDTATLEALLSRLIPQAQIRVEAVAGTLVLTGSVGSPTEAQQAFDMASKFLGDGSSGTTGSTTASTSSSGVQVINALKIRGKDQVMLRVVIAEVQRTAVKSLGIDLSAAVSAGLFSTVLSSTSAYPVNGTPVAGSSTAIGFGNSTNSVSATVTALEQDGLLKVLSEPTLTAISGEEATFLVGGEYPIPVASENNVVTVAFKKYGVGLGFIPVVLSDGRISLKVSTEVSEPSSEGAITVGSSTSTSSKLSITSLRVRRASSTVEMSSGSTMVMAGLISDDTRQAIAGTPGLMNLPILGTLFRSRDFQRSQTELAVFVQPVLVVPVAPGKLVRPDQNLAPASDAAANFLGRLNKVYRSTDRDPPGRYQGQYGFIYE